MSEQKAPLTKRDRQLRRRVWLGVYLPVILGGLAALGLVVVVGVFGFREENVGGDPASVGGDVAAIIVIAQVLIIFLIPLALSAALAYLSLRLVRGIHPLLKRGQDLAAQAASKVEGLMDSLAGAFIRVYAQGARWQAIVNYLRRSDVKE
jgi:amino acid transporter